MVSPRVYLDHNATAPLRPQAKAAALEALALAANPSSVHAEGRRARALVEDARRQVASLVGSSAERVVFTSGATEAAHLALSPDTFADGRRGFDRLLVGATEHAAVLHGPRFGGDAIETVPVSAAGGLDLAALSSALARGGRAMVAVQAANNETGVLQPMDDIAALAWKHDGVVVCDAVQAAGRIACNAVPADVLLLSAHKLGGLAGAGAVVMLSDRVGLGAAVLRGGGQERGFRAGTENVAAIVAFGAAAEAASGLAEASLMAALRDRFEAGLLRIAPDAELFGGDAPRLPNTSAFAVPGLRAETLLMSLDLAGIAVSSGSACASGKVGRSHVLEAMGVKPDLRAGALRVSFGWSSTEADVEDALAEMAATLDRMRGRRLRAAA